MNWRLYLSVLVISLALFAVWIFHLPAQFPYACEQAGVSRGAVR